MVTITEHLTQRMTILLFSTELNGYPILYLTYKLLSCREGVRSTPGVVSRYLSHAWEDSVRGAVLSQDWNFSRIWELFRRFGCFQSCHRIVVRFKKNILELFGSWSLKILKKSLNCYFREHSRSFVTNWKLLGFVSAILNIAQKFCAIFSRISQIRKVSQTSGAGTQATALRWGEIRAGVVARILYFLFRCNRLDGCISMNRIFTHSLTHCLTHCFKLLARETG